MRVDQRQNWTLADRRGSACLETRSRLTSPNSGIGFGPMSSHEAALCSAVSGAIIADGGRGLPSRQRPRVEAMWSHDFFRCTGILCGLSPMKLHRSATAKALQLGTWPGATVIKSLELEASEPGPLRGFKREYFHPAALQTAEKC